MALWNIAYPDTYNGETVRAYIRQDAESAEGAINAVKSRYPQLQSNSFEAHEIDPPGYGVIRNRHTQEMEVVFDPHSTVSYITYKNEALGYSTTVSQMDYEQLTWNQTYQDAQEIVPTRR